MDPMKKLPEGSHPLVPSKFDECWHNKTYEVLVKRDIKPGEPYGAIGEGWEGWPPMTWISVKRKGDKECIRDWRHLQEIKNDIVGVEAEGVEIYPAESRKMDEANQFHIWCLPEGYRWPFGNVWRIVQDHDKSAGTGAVQRRFRQGDRFCEETLPPGAEDYRDEQLAERRSAT